MVMGLGEGSDGVDDVMTVRGYKSPDAEVRGPVVCRGRFAGSRQRSPQSTVATAGQRDFDWLKLRLHARRGKEAPGQGYVPIVPAFFALWLHAIDPQQLGRHNLALTRVA